MYIYQTKPHFDLIEAKFSKTAHSKEQISKETAKRQEKKWKTKLGVERVTGEEAERAVSFQNMMEKEK